MLANKNAFRTYLFTCFVVTSVILGAMSSLRVYAMGLDSLATLGIDKFVVQSPTLATAGQPGDAAFAEMAKAGVTHVVNLRGVNEHAGFDERARVEALGMVYVNIPMVKSGDFNRHTLAPLHRLLADPKTGKVFMHCASSNRAGAALALMAYWFDGATAEQAWDIGIKAGMSSTRSLVQRHLQQAQNGNKKAQSVK